MRDYFAKEAPIRFANWIDGDCINERDGIKTENGIRISVLVEAPAFCEIVLNGKRMEEEDGVYRADVELCGYRNALFVEDTTNHTSARICLFYLKAAVGRFRFSSDDNILFLQDITENQDKYRSIFDNPYLAIYKKAHDLYGAKVHLNLFYELDEKARGLFSKPRPYFNLSMMTDKFKDEFAANADWLKLAFHANSEYPNNPYTHATAEEIAEDCLRVHREIVRFAGTASISNSTTVHWGSGNAECIRALRSLGYRSLTGYFIVKNGYPAVAYYVPTDLCEHIEKRDFWYDTDEDMLFGRIDRVTNIGPLEKIMEDLENVAKDPHRGGFVSVMIHEQYFYEDYVRYLPDFAARVLEPCRYLYEQGYVGGHVTEITREPNLCENPKF